MKNIVLNKFEGHGLQEAFFSMVVLPLYLSIFQFLLRVFNHCNSTTLPLSLSISSSKCLKYINKMCNIFSGFTCKMKLVDVAFCLCIFMKTSFPTHLYFPSIH